MYNNRRQFNRIPINLPIFLIIDSVITIKGQLKDLSKNSAFMKFKSHVYIKVHDEYRFKIHTTEDGSGEDITGLACVSRIAPGEGVAIYFTEMDDESTQRLSQLLIDNGMIENDSTEQEWEI